MASITFAAGALTKTFTVSTADLNRVIAGLKTSLGKPALTNAEVFDVWANSTMQALKDVVRRAEGDTAADAARAAVVDVVAS